MTDQSPEGHDRAKRARLIESAAAEFSRRGFEGAAIKEIAAGAGVANGTVYLYFANKAKLFLAVLEELQSVLAALLPKSEGDVADEARRFVRAHLTIADSSPDLFRCYTSALFGVNREFQAAALGIFAWQRDRLAAIERVLRREGRPPWTVRQGSVAVGCINAAALIRGLVDETRHSTRPEESMLLSMLLEGL